MSDRPSDYIGHLRTLVGHAPIFMPSACCAVLDTATTGVTRVLLQQRGEPGRPWGLPGGAMELGETVEQAAVRETWEETGLHVEPTELLGVFSAETHTYANGDVVQAVVTVLVSRASGGELRADGAETVAVAWFDLTALPEPLFAPHVPMLDALRAGSRGVWA